MFTAEVLSSVGRYKNPESTTWAVQTRRLHLLFFVFSFFKTHPHFISMALANGKGGRVRRRPGGLQLMLPILCFCSRFIGFGTDSVRFFFKKNELNRQTKTPKTISVCRG